MLCLFKGREVDSLDIETESPVMDSEPPDPASTLNPSSACYLATTRMLTTGRIPSRRAKGLSNFMTKVHKLRVKALSGQTMTAGESDDAAYLYAVFNKAWIDHEALEGESALAVSPSI